MTIQIIAQWHPVARKHHRCYHCGGWIAPGVKHEAATLKYDDVYTLRSHIDCQKAADEYVSHGYAPDYDDGVPPLYEMIENGDGQYDLDAMRGHWPHVVCRIELGRQQLELRAQAWLTQWKSERAALRNGEGRDDG
jgi:hypothetical protein